MDNVKIEHCGAILNLENGILTVGEHSAFIDGQISLPIDSNPAFDPGIYSAYNNMIVGETDFLTSDASSAIFCLDGVKLGAECDQSEVMYYTNSGSEPLWHLNGDENIQSLEYQIVNDNGTPSRTMILDDELLDIDSLLEDPTSENEISGGQYFVQYDDSRGEDSQDSLLCKVENQQIGEPTNQSLDFLDISKVTGKDYLTGQTVTLGSYLEKLKSSNDTYLKTPEKVIHDPKNQNQQKALSSLLNKKLTIGQTTNGKRLVGKIIHVGQKGENIGNKTQGDPEKKHVLGTVIMNGDGSNNNTILTENQDKTVNQKGISCNTNNSNDNNPKNTCTNENVLQIISNLMAMETVAKKLMRKNLLITIIEKDVGNNNTELQMFDVQGHLEMKNGCKIVGDEENWIFKVVEDPINESHGFWCPRRCRRKFQESMKLTASIFKMDDVTQSTKVNLSPQQEKCSLCPQEFKTLYKLKMHLKAVHQAIEDNFNCETCNQAQEGENIFTLSRQHELGSKRRSGNGLKLSNRMLTHDNHKFVCTVCDEQYEKISLWRKHMLTHKEYANDNDTRNISVNAPKIYICKVCKRTFSRYSNLHRHSEIHGTKNSMSNFSCSMCGCTYNYISSLTRHIVQNHLKVS